MVRGLSPTAALMFLGKIPIYVCHSPPGCSKWVAGRKKSLNVSALNYHGRRAQIGEMI